MGCSYIKFLSNRTIAYEMKAFLIWLFPFFFFDFFLRFLWSFFYFVDQFPCSQLWKLFSTLCRYYISKYYYIFFYFIFPKFELQFWFLSSVFICLFLDLFDVSYHITFFSFAFDSFSRQFFFFFFLLFRFFPNSRVDLEQKYSCFQNFSKAHKFNKCSC